MISIIKGNLFSSKCQTLVNTVNCVGVMGAGIALEFKLRYPEMFVRYVEHCRNKQIDIGKLWLYKPPQADKQWVLNFPTKRDWKHPSRIEYLQKGLQRFVETYQQRGIQSIAFPILGSQNGKIPESESVAIMARYLYRCDVDIEIYRYSPDVQDDLYEVLKQRFAIDSDEKIAAAVDLTISRVSILRKALNDSKITTVGQLATIRGIGQKTLERVFQACLSSGMNGQLEFDIRPRRPAPN
jgi:O-acetyl-ADP-ribose deacetylase (regulator of RNase III)